MAGHWFTVSANMEGTVLTQEELEAYGMSMWIDLNEDGTAVMFMEGEQMDGINWSVADNMLVLTLGGDFGVSCHTVSKNGYHIVSRSITVNRYHIKGVFNIA